MSTSAVVLLILAVLGFVLLALRGCGVGHPRFDFGFIGLALFALIYIITVVIV